MFNEFINQVLSSHYLSDHLRYYSIADIPDCHTRALGSCRGLSYLCLGFVSLTVTVVSWVRVVELTVVSWTVTAVVECQSHVME